MVTETAVGLSSLVTSLMAFLWFAWVVRLLQIATSHLGHRVEADPRLSESDVRFLRGLHIRL